MAARRVQEQAITVDSVRAALANINKVYGALRRYERRDLMHLVLKRAEVSEREITLEVFALTDAPTEMVAAPEGDKVRAGQDWLPE